MILPERLWSRSVLLPVPALEKAESCLRKKREPGTGRKGCGSVPAYLRKMSEAGCQDLTFDVISLPLLILTILQADIARYNVSGRNIAYPGKV